MELTLEISCDKWPQYNEKDYKQYFSDNKESILKFSELGIKITSLAIAMCITHYIIAM
jgi:hypothetical protein